MSEIRSGKKFRVSDVQFDGSHVVPGVLAEKVEKDTKKRGGDAFTPPIFSKWSEQE